MGSAVAVEPRPSRAAGRWPPSARRQGAELSTAALVAILMTMTALSYLVVWAAIPHGLHPMVWAGGVAVVHVVELAGWLAVVGVLGWWRASGLSPGSASAWGIVPLTVLSLATLLVAGIHGAVPYGAAYLVVVVGDGLGAIREEIAFRGFLLYGLTRRFGGYTAALVGSLLFALYHVPRYLREQVPLTEMAALLLVAFGVGVFLCRVRAETGSIWVPAVIHTLWNLLVGVGNLAFPTGDLPLGFSAVQAAPFAVGIVLALVLLARRRGAPATGPLRQTA